MRNRKKSFLKEFSDSARLVIPGIKFLGIDWGVGSVMLKGMASLVAFDLFLGINLVPSLLPNDSYISRNQRN